MATSQHSLHDQSGLEVVRQDFPEPYAPFPQDHKDNDATMSKSARQIRLPDIMLKRFLFFALLAAIIVTGVAVGGAVGGTLAVQKKSNHEENAADISSSTTSISVPTPTSTQSRIAPSTLTTQTSDATNTPTPSSDCPLSNRTIDVSDFTLEQEGPTTPEMGLKFEKLCSVDTWGYNLAESVANSFNECIELCASFNFWNNNAGCVAVSFHKLDRVCYVHNQTSELHLGDDSIDMALLSAD
ncbi:hypothetical protein GGR57DRAFT_282143 [Xylariaceae sp. FL1272]|nr:hypothetical protein GGR57DRAFT_282143 [Xylariaceae sp. FL1272]